MKNNQRKTQKQKSPTGTKPAIRKLTWSIQPRCSHMSFLKTVRRYIPTKSKPLLESKKLRARLMKSQVLDNLADGVVASSTAHRGMQSNTLSLNHTGCHGLVLRTASRFVEKAPGTISEYLGSYFRGYQVTSCRRSRKATFFPPVHIYHLFNLPT